ncbi:transcriptional Coactivator p15-domain-containing protein [Russula dissimulans]|nr:transcriptional Coactivator p15-domain-containing protein [Russula dissimulans]
MERPGKSSKEKGSSSKRSSKSRGLSVQKFSKRKTVDQEESDSGEGAQPLEQAEQPPQKTVKKPRISSPSDGSDADPKDDKLKLRKNSEGDAYVDLGKRKRVTVRSFKGQTLVDIREYYGDDGDEKPGKKGISLSVEQWNNLVQASRAISDLL